MTTAEMVRGGLHAKADEMRTHDATMRAEWEAETELGFPMAPAFELSHAMRNFVAELLDALADNLAKVLLGYLATVAVIATLVVALTPITWTST